jgi:hypothetical protein
VFGSVQRDSGTAWFLQARDSMTKKMDTALMLQRPNGTQSWLRGSTLLPWEPQPWNGVTGSWKIASDYGYERDPFPFKADSVGLPWGLIGVSVTPGEDVPDSVAYAIGFGDSPFATTGGSDLAPGIWSDTFGLLRTRMPNSFGTQGQTLTLRWDWLLVSHNALPVTHSPVKLQLPDSGDTYVWEEHTQSYPNPAYDSVPTIDQLRWEVLTRPADSVGWSRLFIRQTKTEAGAPDSVSNIYLRFNGETEVRLPPPSSHCPDPGDGWWPDWADSINNQGRFRHFFGDSITFLGTGQTWITPLSWREWITPTGVSDSMSCDSSQTLYDYYTTYFYTTRVLLSVNGVQIRQSAALATPKIARAKLRESLTTLAARYPSATIHWHDIQGRSGKFPANQLSRNGPATGLLFLDATFPDGTRWTGSYLEGVR